MPRIPPVSSAEPPEASLPLLESLEQLGPVSNFLRTLAHSPAALEGYLGFCSSLNKGALPPATARRIALAIAELNACDYSLSSNIELARRVTRLSDAEITANRNGSSNDPKAQAAVRFAVAVARQRGRVSEEQFQALRAAGYDHAHTVEIVHHVALAMLTQYLNAVAGTEIDFPLIRSRKPAAPAGEA